MISLVELTAALQCAWMAAEGEQVPTQFPGMPLDATRLMAWFECWVTQVDEPPARGVQPHRLVVFVDIHCFSRRPEKRQVLAMADRVRAALAHQVIPFLSNRDEAPQAGVLRLREAAVRDLTREASPEPKVPLQHLIVSLTGSAEHLHNDLQEPA